MTTSNGQAIVPRYPAFALCHGATERELARCEAALRRFGAPLPDLELLRSDLGGGQVLWLFARREESGPVPRGPIAAAPDLFVVGTPFGDLRRSSVLRDLEDPEAIALDGRWAAVSLDRQQWTVTTDWARSVPIYHAALPSGGIISNIEPVVAHTCAFGLAQLNRRGLVALLSFGHFMGDDTLFTPMSALPADVRVRFSAGRLQHTEWRNSVIGSDTHHGLSLSETVEKMAELSREAVLASLGRDRPIWLPLSAGMDARLTAAIAGEAKIQVDCVSYGPQSFAEVQLAAEIARAHGHRWRRLDIDGHVQRYAPSWYDQFGASLHLHGTHHYPLLDAIPSHAVVPSGWLGNSSAGGAHPAPCLFDERLPLLERFKGYGVSWPEPELARLLRGPIRRELDELEEMLRLQVKRTHGWPHYQQMNALDLWNRQGRFVFFQTEMLGWRAHEVSPYMARRYSRFTFSLPSHHLWLRKAQIEMLDRHFPRAAAIDGSFRQHGSLLTKQWHRLRYHATKHAPARLRHSFGHTWYSDFWRDEPFFQGLEPASLELSELFDTQIAQGALQAAARNRPPLGYKRLLVMLPVVDYFRRQPSNQARTNSAPELRASA